MNRTEDNPKLLRKKEYEIEETVFAKYKDGAQLYRATVLEKVTSASKRRGGKQFKIFVAFCEWMYLFKIKE